MSHNAADCCDEVEGIHEDALLSCMLAGPYGLAEIANIVNSGDYLREGYGTAHNAVLDLSDSGAPLTPVAVEAELRKRGISELLGGRDAVFQLIREGEIQKHAAKYHAQRVASSARNRKLRKILSGAFERASGGEDSSQVIPELEADLGTLSISLSDTKVVTHAQAMSQVIDEVKEAREFGGQVGVKTELDNLDEAIGSMPNGELIILAARPSIGKSIVGAEIAQRNAEAGRCVLFASLEMSISSLGQRFHARQTGIPTDYFRDCSALDDGDMAALERSAERAESQPLHLWARPGASISELRAVARMQHAKTGLDLLVVDYLGLMSGKGRDTYERVSSISKAAKQLALELNIPILMLAQLNRDSEKNNRRPQLHDLRDSGSIEQDADMVWFIVREREATDCILNIAKFRNGPLGDVELEFDGARCRVSDKPKYKTLP